MLAEHRTCLPASAMAAGAHRRARATGPDRWTASVHSVRPARLRWCGVARPDSLAVASWSASRQPVQVLDRDARGVTTDQGFPRDPDATRGRAQQRRWHRGARSRLGALPDCAVFMPAVALAAARFLLWVEPHAREVARHVRDARAR